MTDRLSDFNPLPKGLIFDRYYRSLSLPAARLLVDAHQWANEQETDGCLSLGDFGVIAMLPAVEPKSLSALRDFAGSVIELVDELVVSGLITKINEHHFTLANFRGLDHDVRDRRRAATAERYRRWSERHRKAKDSLDTVGINTNAVSSPVGNATLEPEPEPEPEREREAKALSEPALPARARGAGPVEEPADDDAARGNLVTLPRQGRTFSKGVVTEDVVNRVLATWTKATGNQSSYADRKLSWSLVERYWPTLGTDTMLETITERCRKSKADIKSLAYFERVFADIAANPPLPDLADDFDVLAFQDHYARHPDCPGRSCAQWLAHSRQSAPF